MITVKNRRAMITYGITDVVEELDKKLMKVDGVEDVEYDLDGFYSGIKQIIFLPKYSIPEKMKYKFVGKNSILKNVVKAANDCGLKRTPDMIEDYGERWYIVTEMVG